MSKSYLNQQITPRKAELKGPQGRRFDIAQRRQALTMLADGIAAAHVASTIGTTTSSLRRWARAPKVPAAHIEAVKQASRKSAPPPVAVVKHPPSFVEIRQAASMHLEIVLRCGIVLRVPESIDGGSLRRLVEVLETC